MYASEIAKTVPGRTILPVWTDCVPIHEDQEHFWSSKPDLAILAASRQIYAEASSVLYEDSWFGAQYKTTDVYSLPKVPRLDLGGPAVELNQLRRLILSFDDGYCNAQWSGNPTKGIMAVLKFYASRTASLTYLGISLCFKRGYWAEEHHMLSKALQDPDLVQVVQSFAVRNEISIRLVQDNLTLLETVEQWAVFIAEHEDLSIYKYRVRHLLPGWTVLESVHHDSVDWSVVPRGKMPLAAWNFSRDTLHLPVAGQMVDSTEQVVHINPD